MLTPRKPSAIRLLATPVPDSSRWLRLLPSLTLRELAWSMGPRRRRRKFIRRATAALLMSSALLANAPPQSGLEGLGSRVSDDQLGDMRGKFVRPGNISYFGISMATSWQNSAQITTSAILLFSVEFLKGAGNLEGANPTVAIAWHRDCEACVADPAMDVAGFGSAAQNGYAAVASSAQPIPMGGLDSVTGAVQSQQIAGIANTAQNAMQIVVVPAASAKQMNPSDLHAISQSTTQNFSDGRSVGFLIGNNSLGLTMANADGSSAIKQSVDGALNQAAQHVLLASDMNVVSSSMTISIGIDSLSQSERLRAESALGAMKDRF